MKLNIINIYSFIFAVSPILAVYIVLPGTSLAFFLILLLLPIFLITTPLNIKKSKQELLLFISILLIGFFGYLYNTKFSWFTDKYYINNHWAIILCFSSLILISKKLNTNIFIKTLIAFSILVSFITIYQRLSLILYGSFFSDFFIPGIELIRSVETFSISRPCSLFSEPAHLCIYLLPAFTYSLLTHKYNMLLLFILGILSSGSTTGFLLIGIIFLIWIFNSNFQFKYFVLSVLILISFFFIITAYFPDVIELNLLKLSEVDIYSNIRFLGTIVYLNSFDLFNYLFGIGFNQLETFSIYHSYFLDETGNYANALLYMFYSYGIFGLIIFITYMVRLYKNNKYSSLFVFVFLGIVLTDQILFNINFMFLLTCIFVFNDKFIYIKQEKYD